MTLGQIVIFGAETGNVIRVKQAFSDYAKEGEFLDIEDAQSWTPTPGSANTRPVTTFRGTRLVQGLKQPDTASFALLWRPNQLWAKAMRKGQAENREMIWQVFLAGQKDLLVGDGAKLAVSVTKDAVDAKLATLDFSGTDAAAVQAVKDGFKGTTYGPGHTVVTGGKTYTAINVEGDAPTIQAIDNSDADIVTAAAAAFSLHLPQFQVEFGAKIGTLGSNLETESQLEATCDLNPTGTSLPEFAIVDFA